MIVTVHNPRRMDGEQAECVKIRRKLPQSAAGKCKKWGEMA